MKILTLEELGPTIEYEKSCGNTLAYIMTTGNIHEGHISLLRLSKSKLNFDKIIIVYTPYLLKFNVLHSDYSSYYKEDCEKLNNEVDYLINIEYDNEVEMLFKEHDVKCRELIDWNKWKHPNIHLENFMKHYIATSLLLTYERLLWNTDFRIHGEKSLFPISFMSMIQRIIYPSIVQKSKDIFFPCVRYKNGCLIDSCDVNSKNIDEKFSRLEIVKKIKESVCKDKSEMEIQKELGIVKNLPNPNLADVMIAFWSGRDLTMVERPSKCVPARFFSSSGPVYGSILSINYYVGGVGYNEQYLFDSNRRMILDEEI